MEIEIYETRKIGEKGQVVIPEKLRNFMNIVVGSEIAFMKAIEKSDGVYEIVIKVIDKEEGR